MLTLYSSCVTLLADTLTLPDFPSLHSQGILRVRKRVTMMVVAIVAIFGICWGMSQFIYVLKYFTSYNTGQALLPISDTMITFNSAVNPLVYALLACEQALKRCGRSNGETARDESASEASRWKWEPARALLFSEYSAFVHERSILVGEKCQILLLWQGTARVGDWSDTNIGVRESKFGICSRSFSKTFDLSK